jgi:transposase
MSKVPFNYYSSEFRASAVKLAKESDQTIAQTARDLGVKVNTLYSWVSDNSKSNQSNMAKNNNEDNQEEIKRLRKQLAIVKQERDLLKKAAAYFAKESR